MQAAETTPHINQGKESHFGTEYRKTSFTSRQIQALSTR